MSTASLLLASGEDSTVARVLQRVSDSEAAHRRVAWRWACLAKLLEVVSVGLTLAGIALLVFDLLGVAPVLWRSMVRASGALAAASLVVRATGSLLKASGRAALYRLTSRMLSRLWHRLARDTGLSVADLECEAEKAMHEVSELTDPCLDVVIVHETDELP